MKENSIIIFIPYFGQWNQWVELFFETVKRNSTIDFCIYTDCDTSIVDAPNVQFKKMSFKEYIEFVNQKLDFRFDPPNAYKVCDLRPLFGYIHQEDFKNHQFYGWCDMDLLFGDIRQFYTDDVLANHDVFSTHAHRISGHLALFRNNKRNRMIFKKIYRWKEALLNPKFVGIDEHGITHAYKMTIFDKLNEKFQWNINNAITRKASAARLSKLYMVEQYTTPFLPKPWLDGTVNSAQPEEWYYRNGEITNNRDGERTFIYIHFMNFKSSQWRHDGTKAPWEGRGNTCIASVADMEKGLKINTEGVSPI